MPANTIAAQVFKRLKKFCKEKPSNAALVAASLGYRTSNTVYAWLKNEAIPERQVENVSNFLNEVKNVT